jgi:hypothetical protein
MPVIKVPLAEPQFNIKKDIADITLSAGETYDMSQHIRGKDAEISDSTVLGLNSSVATYSHDTKLITGVATGTSQGLTYRINRTFGDMSDTAGNIIEFGADPTGVNDSTVAIQAAMDADGAVYIPNGDFKVSSTITISKPKLIYCMGDRGVRSRNDYFYQGGLFRRQTSNTDEEAPRLIATTELQPMILITSDQVRWYGGCLDIATGMGFGASQATVAFNEGICVKVQAQTGFTGGGFYRTKLIGGGFPATQFVAGLGAGGPQGVVFEFNGRPADARICHYDLEDMDARGFWRAYATDATVSNQKCFGNVVEIWDLDCVVRAIEDHATTNSRFKYRHQGRRVFANTTQRDTVPAIYFAKNDNACHELFPVDFTTLSQTFDHGTYWQNLKSVQTDGKVVFPLRGLYDFEGLSIGQILTAAKCRTELVQFDDTGASSAGYFRLKRPTQTEIANASDRVNTRNKHAGSIIFQATGTLRPLVALGSSPTDRWVRFDYDAGDSATYIQPS